MCEISRKKKMSEENGSKKLSGLRQYRFQKASIPEGSAPSSSNLVNIPGRKRIKLMADSDSDADSPKKTSPYIIPPESANFSISEKEARLIAVKCQKPDIDTMVMQDALVRNEWDVDKALDYINNNPGLRKRKIDPVKTETKQSDTKNLINNSSSHDHSTKSKPLFDYTRKPSQHSSNSTSNSSSHSRHNNHHNHNRKPKHSSRDKSGEADESNSDTEKPIENVFDSDEDSDTGAGDSVQMSKSRRNVLDFLNNAKENELIAIKTCSQRKAEALLSLRPFTNWCDLVTKLQTNKIVKTDLLNECQAFLTRRENLMNIMKKCTKIVQRLETAVSVGGGVSSQPSILNPEYKLAEYQLVGLNWLAVMHNEQTNGILADEMGLGKTIQVIAFLSYLKEAGLAKSTHLVIVPSSTLDNWDIEFQRWSPSLVVAKYYGSADERRALRIQWAKNGFKGIDVILTTYRTVITTPEEKKMFRISPIHYVVFDEAHMLKNMTTQRYAYLVRINAQRRILLTGTPLQNNLLELMSLLCFVMPSIFAKKSEDIKSLFQKAVKNKESSEDTNKFEQSQIEQAKRIMKPFVLRRLKRDVLKCLPPKTTEVIKVPLISSQKEKYTDLVHSFSSETGIVKATHDQSGISMMMDMRKLSNHPLLMRYYFTDEDLRTMSKILSTDMTHKETNAQYIFEDIAVLSDFKIYELTQKYPSLKRFKLPNELILEAGKIKQLDILLPKLKQEGHRVLIFSQFIMMLDILEKYLEIRDFGYMRLDGQTAVVDRQNMIDEYNGDSDYFVFLLSTRAGGLGINLTAADTVIIYDIDFNPYNDKQAEDRCHRMGQKNPVKIYKLISEGTIDEGMFMVAEEKLKLEKEVTNNGVEDDVQEHKCMIKLLTMALGTNSTQAESMLSPTAKIKMKTSNSDDEQDY